MMWDRTFDGFVLKLTGPSPDGCGERGRDLGRAWLKRPNGAVRVVVDARRHLGAVGERVPAEIAAWLDAGGAK